MVQEFARARFGRIMDTSEGPLHTDHHHYGSQVMRAHLFIASIVLTAQGCALTPATPEHLYSPPVLEGIATAHVRAHDAPAHPEASTMARRKTKTPAGTRGAARARASATGSSPSARGGSTPGPSKHRSSLPSLASTRRAELKRRPEAAPPADADDAAAHITRVLARRGHDIPDAARGSVPALDRWCKKAGKIRFQGTLSEGDIVFFHNTADLNGDGRNNDWYTHVGLVRSVDEGTATLEALGGSEEAV
ncbi:MAG: hypothetical protein AAGI01_06335, partial [Myxococcota bacterium]